MFNYVWSILLVVVSNVLYQVCAKSLPNDMNPFASLTVTYFVGTIFSFALYFIMSNKGNILIEYRKMNAAPVILGIVLVGLEVGFLYAYKNGWQVSTLSIVQSAFLAAVLIFVGWFGYNEVLTWNKIIGAAVCLVGLYFINMK
ncbi:MAG: DMT family transporter [Clostridiales bacterium]|nr:DMT family transporter [Clostridiales bacterium]